MKICLVLLASAATAMAAGFKKTALVQHNAARALHGAPKLKWSRELAAIAQSHTNSCEFKHKVDGDYGQNLGWSSGSDAVSAMADMVTETWYGEVSAFTQYGAATPNMGSFSDWGHFSQLTWKDTQEVGCAYSACNGAYFFECNYSPPGNVAGQYGANVAPAV
ncbi:CAP domain-containing protein [Microdochium bolleyi]|uniref:CAP domain-containing protein n=1 Tax=Microdochium bolleyi TaxID=196109 RepID=A0A136J8L6_9PEZI|nr:CAP domain-containing protein [Microdochium bolleyi]